LVSMPLSLLRAIALCLNLNDPSYTYHRRIEFRFPRSAAAHGCLVRRFYVGSTNPSIMGCGRLHAKRGETAD
jgi:hypothetical protein